MTTKEMLTSVINGTINDEVKAKARGNACKCREEERQAC